MAPSQYPQADSLTRFARGLGMARSGDIAGAKQEIEAIKALRTALEKRTSRKRGPKAVVLSGELLRDLGRQLWNSSEWQIRVEDEDG